MNESAEDPTSSGLPEDPTPAGPPQDAATGPPEDAATGGLSKPFLYVVLILGGLALAQRFVFPALGIGGT